MRRRGLTIGRLMLAVAGVALVLALVRAGDSGAAVIGSYIGVALGLGFGAWRLGRAVGPRKAAWLFWASAVGSSLSVIAGDACLPGLEAFFVILLEAVLMVPVVLGSGCANASASTAADGRGGRPRLLARTAIVLYVALIFTTVVTQWPSGVVFLASRSALDRLADRVGAGNPPPPPVRAGRYWIVAYAVDARSGNVALITDPNPSGRSGFVRVRPGASHYGPLINFFHERHIVGPWWFEVED